MSWGSRRISDRRVLKLRRQWLHVGVMEEGRWQATERGGPPGGVRSPLLANSSWHVLERGTGPSAIRHGGGRTRSADEVGIVCRTQSAAQRALAAVTQAGQKLTLTLHPTKTRIVEMQHEGGELLGFHCQRSERGRVGDGGPAWGRAREP
jgi:RNA-directed DNA polymerase